MATFGSLAAFVATDTVGFILSFNCSTIAQESFVFYLPFFFLSVFYLFITVYVGWAWLIYSRCCTAKILINSLFNFYFSYKYYSAGNWIWRKKKKTNSSEKDDNLSLKIEILPIKRVRRRNLMLCLCWYTKTVWNRRNFYCFISCFQFWNDITCRPIFVQAASPSEMLAPFSL